MTSTSKMSSNDEYLDHMLIKALKYQQDYYELLPDWVVYKKENMKHLKRNIGHAIFGSPLFEKDSDSNDILNYQINKTDDREISDLVHYGPTATEMINMIIDQIHTYGRIPGDDTIKCGIIYVILFDHNSSEQHDKNKVKEHIALPLFKILKCNNNDNVSKSNSNKDTYTTWYIDIKGRVYQGWEDFIKANDLPKCIMVYPKDGYYQPNPNFAIRPNNSKVWVIAQDTYACCQRACVMSKVNTVVNTVGAGATVGLGVATLFTPIGPAMAAAGVATTSISGIWTIGKCATELYDRSIHKESISLTNKSALSSWLGIAGCTVGIGVNVGSALLKQAASLGKEVGTIAKTTYNVTLIGSISINLIGLGYQGANMYNKYQETGKVDMQDIVYFGTHLLFFAGSVVNVKFANDIIEATQGEVMKEFETNLRNDNLRKRYDFIKNKAAETHGTDKIGQNAEIIRYINEFNASHVSELLPISNSLQSSSNVLMTQQYKLKLNGVTLIDPILFVADIAKSYLHPIVEQNKSNSYSEDNSHILMTILDNLLTDLYTSRDCPINEKLLSIPDFKTVIDDLKNVRSSEHILPFVFNISLILIKSSKNCMYLVEGCRFIWNYIKRLMREGGLEIFSIFDCPDTKSHNSSIQYMRRLLQAVFDAMDTMVNRFFNALIQYIHLSKKQISYSRV